MSTPAQRRPPALVAIALVALVCGIFVRFYGLDRFVYGFDETATSLRVAGATLPAFERALATRSAANLAEIRARYQSVGPASSFGATIDSLANDDPQHPPAYYLIARAWRNLGDAIALRRVPSAVFGIALVAAAWRFGRVLYDRETGCVLAALIAVSPFEVAFARYDREYALWGLLTVLASTALARALERGGAARWIAYAVLSAIGLYTDTLFAFVLLAHGAFAASAARDRFRAFGVAALGSIVAFVPWLVVLVAHADVARRSTNWNAVALPAKLMIAKWGFEVTAVFFDAEYARINLVPVSLALVIVAAFATAAAFARPDRRSVLFALALFVVPVAALVVPDLVFHASRSTASRYLTAAWFALDVLVAAGLAHGMRSAQRLQRGAAVAGFVALLAGGTYSCAVATQQTAGWIDIHDASLVRVAAELDRRPGAVLCFVDVDETALILSDAVTTPVSLGNVCGRGAYAVATADGIARVRPRGGSFVAVTAAPGDGADNGTALARFHADAGRAHGAPVQERELWVVRP